jgi:hypothetical protein
LHPAADPGVRRVSGRISRSLRREGEADLSRRRASYPSEGCSSPTAAPCRHGRCLLAVTLADGRFRGHRRTRLRGLAPSSSPVRPSSVAGGGRPCLPWAWFPFKVLPFTPRSGFRGFLTHRPRTGEDGRPEPLPVVRLSRLGPKPGAFPAPAKVPRTRLRSLLPSRRRPARAGGRERSLRPVAVESAASGKKKKPIRPVPHTGRPVTSAGVACRARTGNCLLR